MYKEYIEFYDTYQSRYGPKTAIFLMVGSFYELYDIQNRDTGNTRCNIREVVDLLGIQLSSKKGDFSENEDGLFAGFPDYVMHKYAGRLTSIGWTVVIVNQVKDTRGKVTKRNVERILSPSTHIENATSTDIPYIVTLYMDQRNATQPPTFGASVLDLTTGSTHSYAGTATGRADIWTADDLVQLLSVFPPKELLLYWRATTPLPAEAVLRRMFGIPSQVLIHRYSVETLGAFAVEEAKQDYLRTIYAIQSLLPPKTYLGLTSQEEEHSLLFLLQFVEEHYPSMVRLFQRNQHWSPQERLICGNHALTQLQMTGPQLQETVIGLFDKCITSMGKRAIRERLLRPYSRAKDIEVRLQEVRAYMEWPESRQKCLERQLRFMYDLPRLHRKILCGVLATEELVGLFQTYAAMEQVRNQVTNNTCLDAPCSTESWDAYRAVCTTHFSEEKALRANNDQTAFSSTTYPDIAMVEKDIQATLEGFYTLRKEIATIGGVQEEAIRMEEKEKEPYGFKASTITLQHLKRKMEELPKGMKFSELKSGGWLDCTALQQFNTSLIKHREELQRLSRIHMVEACQAMSRAGQHLWSDMEKWICLVDETQCIGRVSRERGYVCPQVEEVDTADALVGSACHITNIRHPLVESSANSVTYVTHNVELGYTPTKGWLVYGMNASGKSTLMKAVGLCVLMAQAGCFVPAKNMRLKPFQAIYTRILNQDNLFAGLSSFAVEMSELRDILRHANEYTLVLGDELCSGTESISAQALVASGIQWLSSRAAKFIFATHLHDLPNYLSTETLGVKVWHLHVEYDPVSQRLVYDRTLRPGNGSTLYGLEVARAMDLPFEFIEQALANRHQMTGSTKQMDAVSSSWNREVVKRACEVCQDLTTRELEVHHIQTRASATDSILPDGTSMNHKQNLIVLCQTCHDGVHAGRIQIGPKKQTSNGPLREMVMSVPPPPSSALKKGKWSDKDIELAMSTLKQCPMLALKSIRALLSSKYGLEMSESVLSKMRKEL